MKISRFRVAETAVGILSGLLLFGGVANAQSIDTTGPDSRNEISTSNKCDVRVRNDNDVRVVNNNPQTAVSGDAEADRNTSVGSVGSGDASNSSSVSFNVGITNGGASCYPAEEKPVVTPTEGTPEVVTSVTPSPMGGRGAGAEVHEAQVRVPVGGVGAGNGGISYLSGLVTLSIASGALALARANRQLKGQM